MGIEPTEPLASGGFVPADARPVVVVDDGCLAPLREGVMPEWLGVLLRNR